MPLVGKHLVLALVALDKWMVVALDGWMGDSPSKPEEHRVSFSMGLINMHSWSVLQSTPHKGIDGPDMMSIFPKT